jgi:hypothetical protein
MSLRSLLIAVVASIYPCASTAGTLVQCQQSAQQAPQDCQKTMDQIKAAKTSQSTSAANTTGVLGTGGSDSVGPLALSNVAGNGAAMDQQGITSCTNTKKSECDDPCTNMTPSSPKPPTPQTEQQEAKTAKDKCDAQLDKDIADLEASKAGLSTGQQQASNTGNQATGIPSLPSSSPSPSPDPTTTPSTPTPSLTQTPTPTTPTTPTQACTTVDAAGNADCVTQLTQTCANGSTSATCTAFNSQYCGSGASGLTSPTTSSSSTTYNAGQGLTDNPSYCQSALAAASSFQCTGSAMACPSCTGQAPVAGATIPAACASDPAFANPAVAAAAMGSTGSSGGGSSGGGSGGGSTGSTSSSSPVATADGKPVADPMASLLGKMNMSTEGGGGGGGSSGGGSSGGGSNEVDPLSMLTEGQRRALASLSAGSKGASIAAQTAAAGDVGSLREPSVFRISSAVMLDHCQHGKFMHCRPK